MQAGSHREALRRVADRLGAEFSDPEDGRDARLRSAPRTQGGMGEVLGADDEALVGRLREILTGIASALSSDTERRPAQLTRTTLDGSEFVIRHALAGDEPERVLELLPSFAFLVALSVADRDRALEVSDRAAELIERR